MAIEIDAHSLRNVGVEAKAHLLPCHVDYDGQCKANEFFHNCTREKTGEGYIASFRGRPLDGKSVRIPEGFTGYVLEEPRKEFGEEENRTFRAVKKFKEFTLWNLDKPPSDYDKYPNAMKWIDIAAAIHTPT